MAATQPHRQGGKTVSLSSGYAVAAITGQPGSSTVHPVPMNDIGSATLAQEPNMADLIRAAEARVALLEAAALELESDSDPDTDSVTCHSVDVGDGTVSLGQPLPSTAQESPSVGVYSSPLPTTTPTPTNYSAGPGGNTYDAVDSVYMSSVFTGQPGTASDTGLSHTRPVPHSHWASTGQPGASAGALISMNFTDSAQKKRRPIIDHSCGHPSESGRAAARGSPRRVRVWPRT